MAASDYHFYSRLFSELSTALTSYVSDTASNIIGAITPVATTLLTIYVMLWGWSMMRGMIRAHHRRRRSDCPACLDNRGGSQPGPLQRFSIRLPLEFTGRFGELYRRGHGND